MFAALIDDEDVSTRLVEATRRPPARGARCDGVPLGVRDVALWTWLRAESSHRLPMAPRVGHLED